MPFQVPGLADDVSSTALSAWNQAIETEFRRQTNNFPTRLMVLDPTSISGGQPADARWVGSPAEPEFCFDAGVARQLSDWERRGRDELHNEYCEYHITFSTDANGRRRPKRVEVTTELREYWLTLAAFDPEALRRAATEVLGRTPAFTELYGAGGSDPASLSSQARAQRFAREVAGDGAVRPAGRLNRDNALFMKHPINGLDDLVFIVFFGAVPRRVRLPNGAFRTAALHEIFVHAGTNHLACRHADPAAAAAAHDAVSAGQTIAFRDPLGVYLRPFPSESFVIGSNEDPVPESWVKLSRGEPGFEQRLVFGPPDDEDVFLDDITLLVGNESRKLNGGYDVASQIEVGPLLVAGPQSQLFDSDFETIDAAAPLDCRAADVCSGIGALKTEFEAENGSSFTRVGPRRMGRVGGTAGSGHNG